VGNYAGAFCEIWLVARRPEGLAGDTLELYAFIVRRIIQFLNWGFGFLANTLQVSGLTLHALISVIVGTIVLVIGWLENVAPFGLAIGVAAAFGLVMYGLTKLKAFARPAVAGHQPVPQVPVQAAPVRAANPAEPPLCWLRPSVAVDVLAAPELAQAREQRLARMREADNQVRAQRARQNAEVLRQAGIPVDWPDEPRPLDPVEEQALAAVGLANRELLEERYNQANAEVMTDIHAKLATGELRARGFVPPLRPDGQAIDIPAEQWRFLRLNVAQETAGGQGITYVAVALARVERAQP
jgi:hypothetical protein